MDISEIALRASKDKGRILHLMDVMSREFATWPYDGYRWSKILDAPMRESQISGICSGKHPCPVITRPPSLSADNSSQRYDRKVTCGAVVNK